ncbi:hypothetical protein PAMC26510_23885 [Caballeronia sordidicola]|uniref:Uncharacterized protein n=1 Tax=Caballeronia sordidicola TaxID=196367 RepID=A0A242MIC9_CABSO|nr:hypothetical protein PAMC26510_23885 [Caballeronia sordidicola]
MIDTNIADPKSAWASRCRHRAFGVRGVISHAASHTCDPKHLHAAR